ncbi:transposase (plasmid) [Paracoccus ferrooxidans]|nr:transposase [Paracoccus ferrooxidans]
MGNGRGLHRFFPTSLGLARTHDRRVLNGIFSILRTAPPWRDLPERYGPHATASNRWARVGVWLRVFEALAAASLQSMPLIDSSIIRAHQHAAGEKGPRIMPSTALVED